MVRYKAPNYYVSTLKSCNTLYKTAFKTLCKLVHCEAEKKNFLHLRVSAESNEFSLTEATVHRCSVKKVSLETSQNSQGTTCVKETLAQVFSCGFCEASKNTSLYRIPLAAASGLSL